MHGGKTPTGLANANTRTGRYSRALPARMLARYGLACADPKLLSLRDDIALLQAQIDTLLLELREGEGAPDIERVVEQIETIAAEWKTWDYTRMDAELGRLAEMTARRPNERAVMDEVRELLKAKAHLIRQEHRRLAELEQTLTVEQAVLLAQALVGIVRRNLAGVDNANDRLRAIAAQIREVMSKPDKLGRA
jgi:hypothetical protein